MKINDYKRFTQTAEALIFLIFLNLLTYLPAQANDIYFKDGMILQNIQNIQIIKDDGR